MSYVSYISIKKKKTKQNVLKRMGKIFEDKREERERQGHKDRKRGDKERDRDRQIENEGDLL